MVIDSLTAQLGRMNLPPAFRLGLSASYRPGRRTVCKALDEGINYFFFFGFDTHMTGVLREVLPPRRDRCIVATGAYNYIWAAQDLKRTLEKRLRQLRTDYIDVFHFLGVTQPEQLTARVRDGLQALREDPRVRGVSISTHHRKFAGELATQGALDALMIRYNAAHRGAEQDIFPHLAPHHPGIVSFTATRWRALLRPPRGWPRGGRVPTAGMCYRFVLSNPAVDVCLTAPRSVAELDEDLAAVRQGPLCEEDMQFMRDFGDAVYRRNRWFM